MKKEAEYSTIAYLAIPTILLGVTFAERALLLFPDEIVALYMPLWIALILACPICGVISIRHSIIYRGSILKTTIGLTLGFIQIGLGAYIFMGISRIISIPLQT
jgi:hypothetical protein